MRRLDEKIFDLEAASERVREWQSEGLKVCFTNGCFDLLHKGHVHYLIEARSMADRLVGGVNSDHSIQRLKGKSRPIQAEDARLEIVAALEAVDIVVCFSDDTPLKLIQRVLPDIIVKGGDYETHNIVGGDIVKAAGGRVQTVKYLDGYATSTIIHKIKHS